MKMPPRISLYGHMERLSTAIYSGFTAIQALKGVRTDQDRTGTGETFPLQMKHKSRIGVNKYLFMKLYPSDDRRQHSPLRTLQGHGERMKLL